MAISQNFLLKNIFFQLDERGQVFFHEQDLKFMVKLFSISPFSCAQTRLNKEMTTSELLYRLERDFYFMPSSKFFFLFEWYQKNLLYLLIPCQHTKLRLIKKGFRN